VTWTTHHFCHFTWIDFCQTSHEHVSRWCLSTHAWFHIPEKFSIRGRISRKTVFFRVLWGTLFVLSLRVTGNVLRRLHFFRPLVDIPLIYLTLVTFAEWCTVFQLSSSKFILCHSISNGDTGMPIIFQTHSPGGATDRIADLQWLLIHCTFSRFVLMLSTAM